jgi:hypothetical protein
MRQVARYRPWSATSLLLYIDESSFSQLCLFRLTLKVSMNLTCEAQLDEVRGIRCSILNILTYSAQFHREGLIR